MEFLRTLSGVNCGQFWYFVTMPLKIEINLAPAVISNYVYSDEAPGPIALPATPLEL